MMNYHFLMYDLVVINWLIFAFSAGLNIAVIRIDSLKYNSFRDLFSLLKLTT